MITRKCFFLLVVVFISICGCSKEDSHVSREEEKIKPSITDDDVWDDCNATAHPYNLENIIKAQIELGGTLKSANELTLYKYVRFNPDTSEMNVLMQDTTIKLYTIPLADPKLYSWRNQIDLKSNTDDDSLRIKQYAILPLNKEIPNVSYSVLDTLYFPDYETETELYFATHILAGTIKVDSAAVDSMFASTSNLKSAMGWGWLKKAVKWAANTIVGYEPSGTVTMNGNAVEGV